MFEPEEIQLIYIYIYIYTDKTLCDLLNFQPFIIAITVSKANSYEDLLPVFRRWCEKRYSEYILHEVLLNNSLSTRNEKILHSLLYVI